MHGRRDECEEARVRTEAIYNENRVQRASAPIKNGGQGIYSDEADV
jgi:hypothetical protein